MHADLIQIIRQVRRRWRFKLALRGALGVVGLGVLVLLAGNGHCHDTAIVKRVKRRGVDRVISVMPVLDTKGRVAEELVKPKNDFIVVLEVPAEAKDAR